MPYNPQGLTFESGGAVLTSGLASQLEARKGDSITLDWSGYDLQDAPRLVVQVSQIVGATGEGEMAIVDDAVALSALSSAMQQLSRANPEADMPRYTEVFFSLAEPADDATVIAGTGVEPGQLSMERRADRLRSEQLEADRVDAGVRMVKWLGIGLYTLLVIFYAFQRLQANRKVLAVLVTTGASRGTLLSFVLGDTAVFIGLASVLGLIVSLIFFRLQFSFPLSWSVVGRAAGYGLAVNCAVFGLLLATSLWLMRSSNLARLLARVF
jgi:hypothetical protein